MKFSGSIPYAENRLSFLTVKLCGSTDSVSSIFQFPIPPQCTAISPLFLILN